MRKFKEALFGVLLAICAIDTEAACSGCNQNITLTLNKQLSTESNTPGHTEISSSFHVGAFNSGLGRNSIKGNSFTGLNGDLPPYGTKPQDWVYQQIDDYLSVAVRIRSKCGTTFTPFNTESLQVSTCRVGPTNDTFDPSTWESSLKITKKLVSGTYAKNILLGSWGGCKGLGCGRQEAVFARVYLQYSLTVPQNCVVNAGRIIDINFGSIPSSSFKIAGAKPENVNPKSSVIGLECTNIESQANLTMRVQADAVSGNAIVSNDKNVGFVIADVNNRELTPNLLSSFIPFKLDDSARANVTIRVYPVSVTGKKPNEGVVTSLAYLRIDFA